MSIDRFFRKPITSDEWRARARAIQSQLEGLSIDELMRGATKRGEPTGRGSHEYDPHQPRVPAGHPDGGQWTNAGTTTGRAINDPRIISDVTPDNYWIPGADYAAVDIITFLKHRGATCRCKRIRGEFSTRPSPDHWRLKSGANAIKNGYSTGTMKLTENTTKQSTNFFAATCEGITFGLVE